MSTFLAFYFDDPQHARERVQKIAELCSRYLPLAYHPRPSCTFDLERGIAVAHWGRMAAPAESVRPVAGEQGGIFVYDGYVTLAAPEDAPAEIAKRLSRIGNRLQLSESSGGVAAFVWAPPGEGCVYCWSTQPAALGIYWSRGDGFLVAGTRPLLVHLAARESRYIRLDPSFIPIRLAAGSGIDGSTPYAGIRRLSPRSCLLMGKGGAREIDHPLAEPSYSSDDVPSAARRLASILVGSLAPLKKCRSTILMSGGKDSRTITAAAKAAGLDFHGVTYGSGDGQEPAIASLMARMAGVPIEVRRQQVFADPIEAACRSHMRTEGLITAVPHQIRFAAQEDFGTPILHGHGHLLRGGFATDMNPDKEKIIRSSFSPFLSGWVTAECQSGVLAYLHNWAKQRSGGDFRNLQYWAHQDLRLGSHLAPGILDYDGVSQMIYPLLDESVAQFAHSLKIYDKVTERVVFSAIRELFPSLSEIPLYGEMWRFEAKGEDQVFPGRSGRVATVDKNNVMNVDGGFNYIGREINVDLDRFASDFILSSRIYKDIKPMLTDRMTRIVESCSRGFGLPGDEIKRSVQSQRSATRMVRHIFAVCTLYECSWLQPYR